MSRLWCRLFHRVRPRFIAAARITLPFCDRCGVYR